MDPMGKNIDDINDMGYGDIYIYIFIHNKITSDRD